jgi:hypothetical protein
MSLTTLVLICVSILAIWLLLGLISVVLITVLPPPLVKHTKPTVREQIHERLPKFFRSAPRQCLLWGLVAALTCVWAKPDLRFLSFAVVSGALGFVTYTTGGGFRSSSRWASASQSVSCRSGWVGNSLEFPAAHLGRYGSTRVSRCSRSTPCFGPSARSWKARWA